jgi:hypothetical protein
MYQTRTIETQYGTQVCVIRTLDNAHISSDESHADYQAYLAWLAEGNTPEPWPTEEAE